VSSNKPFHLTRARSLRSLGPSQMNGSVRRTKANRAAWISPERIELGV